MRLNVSAWSIRSPMPTGVGCFFLRGPRKRVTVYVPRSVHANPNSAPHNTHGRPGPIGFAEARTALAAGEIVIARPAAFLRNGDEVRFGVRVSTPWISAGAEWPWSAGLHSQPRSSLCVRNCRACPQQALGAEWLF